MTDLAAEIKACFINRKRESPGSTRRSYSVGDQLEDVFEQAATICAKLQAHPVDYVEALFYNVDPNSVYPQFLISSNAIKRYNEHQAQFKVKYPEVFELFTSKLKRQIELGRKIEWILNCKDFDFPAWFRICITKEPIQEIIDNYKPAAKQEYSEALRNFLISKGLEYRRIIEE